MSQNTDRGRRGEGYAAGLLRRKGYRILATNYASRYGEVDVIACDSAYILFVEVKTRRQGSMINGMQAVTPSKMRKIIATAMLYLQEHPWDALQPRFDIVSIETDRQGNVLGHDHLMGAFDSEACK